MTNRYKPVSDRAKATYGEDEFEAELSVVDERDALSAGHLELVPRTYRVLSDNYTAAAQGETFEGAYPVENEAALISGGHIERVDLAQGGPIKKRKPYNVADSGPELFIPNEPGTVTPAPEKKED